MDNTEPNGSSRYPCALVGKAVSLYPWQINGVCAMLLKTLGYIPMGGKRVEKHGAKPEVIAACTKLMGLPSSATKVVKHAHELGKSQYIEASTLLIPGGGFLADQTGLGKIVLVLCFVAWMTSNHCHAEGYNKPTLITCPPTLVRNWAGEAHERFPELNLGLMYADTKSFKSSYFQARSIPTSFTKDLPSLKDCPPFIRSAFTKKDEINPWVIIASLDNFAGRTIKEVKDKSKPKTSSQVSDPNKQAFVIRQRYPTRFVSSMRDMFGIVCSDEGHRLKTMTAQIHYAVRGLYARRD